MYQSFFLMLKAVEFRPATGEIRYAFILYISLRKIIALTFHSELPLGTVHSIEERKKDKKELDVLRNKQKNKNKV